MGQSSASPGLPLVSVIIPVYNAERFVAKTLRSVLAQTYCNVEVLVINDGSTDRTAEIVDRFAQRDQRVRLLAQSNAGVAAARNLGIRQAKGEFVAPIDADDLWYADNLAKQVECLLKSPDSVGLVYSWSVDIDQQDQRTGGFHAARISGRVHATLLCHNFLGNASCTLIRRSCLSVIGGYNEQFQANQAQGCEDWDLYLRLAERYEFAVVPEFLVGYRKLQHSMSYDYQRMANSHDLVLQAVQQRHPKLPGLLYRLSRSSLYIYFAHQCSDNKNHRNTLHWLRQAVQADFTPWLRLGTYLLGFKSLFNLMQQHIHAWINANYASNPARASKQGDKHQYYSKNLQQSHRNSPGSARLPLPTWSNQYWSKGLDNRGNLAVHPSELALSAPWQANRPAIPQRRTEKKSEQKSIPSQTQVTFKVLVGSALHYALSLLDKR